MNDSRKKHLLSNLAKAMQDVPERSQARQLVPFYKADPAYGRGIAKKLGPDMEECIPYKETLVERVRRKKQPNKAAAVMTV